MRLPAGVLAIVPALVLLFTAARTNALETDPFWRVICTSPFGHEVTLADFADGKLPPVVKCGPSPTVFQELPSIGGLSDASVSLDVGLDGNSQRLCFADRKLAAAPVLRVGAGHRLTVQLTNTLHNTGPAHSENCNIQDFGGEGICEPRLQFRERPGADGPYYPIEANQQHTADGTTNLHTHGLFVPPQPCSDEVLRSTIYPANWVLPVAPLQPCQPEANTLTYTYDLPASHPSGLYWYHTHRHGQAEQQTQMGLAGAIVVEDDGDARRAAIGVSDEVLIVTDRPVAACVNGPTCDDPRRTAKAAARARRAAARRMAANAAVPAAAPGGPVLDPRIDEIDQAGGCAEGASDAGGGYELWNILLNGVPVLDAPGGVWPPDSAVLSKTMQPGQRLIFRLVNASADSFIAPQLALKQNDVTKVLPLEVFARDGVGLADAAGNRHFGMFDVGKSPLIVPPAGRIEFAVHAPPPGATLYLQTPQVDPGCGGNQYPARRLLRIASAGTPVDPGAADDSDLLYGSRRLSNYLSTLDAKPEARRTFVLSEYSRDFTYGLTNWLSGPPQTGDYDPNQVDFYLTQVQASDGEVQPSRTALIPFSSHTLAPQVVVHLRGKPSVTEEWLVENATLEIHAFHIHQVHFRDITVDSKNPDLQPVLDTVTVPAAQLVGDIATGYPGAPGWVKLRLTFTQADIGEFVFHCHILEHEDNGMMAKIQVVAD